MNIAISSGHSKLVRGASGYLDEVDEARRVVNRVAELLNISGAAKATVFHDDTSTSQSQNLSTITNWHNSKTRELDVSVHFNAFETTGSPMGCECLYVSQDALAQKVATAISDASGLKNRGPKKRTDLAFLNNTDEPAILIETCFVDSRADADIYENMFDAICAAIAGAISGQSITVEPPATVDPPPGDVSIPIVTVTVDPPNTAAVRVTGDAPLNEKD
jgi:N-acetylmuramoyl-L-alanine amidase